MPFHKIKTFLRKAKNNHKTVVDMKKQLWICKTEAAKFLEIPYLEKYFEVKKRHIQNINISQSKKNKYDQGVKFIHESDFYRLLWNPEFPIGKQISYHDDMKFCTTKKLKR